MTKVRPAHQPERIYRVFHLAGLTWFGAGAIFCGLNLPAYPWMLGSGLVLVWILFGKKTLPSWLQVMVVAFCLCMVSVTIWQEEMLGLAKTWAGRNVELQGVVTYAQRESGYGRMELLVEPGHPLAGKRLEVMVFGGLDAEAGDVVQCTVKLDWKVRPEQLAAGQLLSGSGQIVGRAPQAAQDRLEVRLTKYRQALAETIQNQLPELEGQLLSGMLLGEDQRIPMEERQRFSQAGVAHLLALSGLHLSILTALLEMALSWLALSIRTRRFLTIGVIWGFTALAAFPVSLVRASVMLTLAISAGILGRDPDPLNALGLAAILVLAGNPGAALSLSLQLSYLATMSILLFQEPFTDWLELRFSADPYAFREKHPKAHRFCGLLCLSVSASLLTLPLICWRFGYLSLVSPIVNLMIYPLEPLALGSGLLCGLTGQFSWLWPLTWILSRVASFSVWLIQQVVAFWASAPFAVLPMTQDGPILWMGGALLFLTILWKLKISPALWDYASQLMALSLLGVILLEEVFQGGGVQVAVGKYSGTMALVSGSKASVLLAQEDEESVQGLVDFLKESGVDEVELLITQKAEHLSNTGAGTLCQSFPAEVSFSLEETYGFEAELFGWVKLSVPADGAWMEADFEGMKLVKTFKTESMNADVLVSGDGTLTCSPKLGLSVKDRYHNYQVFTIRPV